MICANLRNLSTFYHKFLQPLKFKRSLKDLTIALYIIDSYHHKCKNKYKRFS